MDLLKAYYKFGNETITPKDVILIVVSSVVSVLTSLILIGGTQKIGFSLLKIILLIIVVIALTPFVVFLLMGLIYHLFFKN